MSTVSYRAAYEVAAEVDGSGAVLDGLLFRPTPSTVRRLADHQLIFRARPGGFVLYAQFDPESGDLRRAPVVDDVTLLFGIRLAEPDFLARFHPDFDATTGPNLYLGNRRADNSVAGSGTLAAGATVEADDAVRLVSQQTTVRADMSAQPVTQKVTISTFFAPVTQVSEFDVTAPANSSSAAVAVSLPLDDGRMYTATATPPGDTARRLFTTTELVASGAFGVLELVLPAGSGGTTAPAASAPVQHRFFARFRPR